MLQDPTLVAVMPENVAEQCLRHRMLKHLSLGFRSRNDSSEEVTRHGAELSAPTRLLVEELNQ